MTALEIVWEEPPASHAGRPSGTRDTYTAQFVEALKEHPGKWAFYKAVKASGAAYSLRQKYPEVDWTTRTVKDDESLGENNVKIYACWVGERDDEDDQNAGE